MPMPLEQRRSTGFPYLPRKITGESWDGKTVADAPHPFSIYQYYENKHLTARRPATPNYETEKTSRSPSNKSVEQNTHRLKPGTDAPP